MRGRDEEGERETEALKGDEDEIGGIANFTALVFVDVEGELDGGADELAELAEAEPDAG